MDKVQVKGYISRDLDEKFRQYIALKHQTVERGLYSYELEQAISQYVAMHGTHTNSTKSDISHINPTPKIFHLKNEIKNYLTDTKGIDFDHIQQVPRQFIIDAIKALRGYDQRTIKHWMEELKKNQCVKEITANLVELP